MRISECSGHFVRTIVRTQSLLKTMLWGALLVSTSLLNTFIYIKFYIINVELNFDLKFWSENLS